MTEPLFRVTRGNPTPDEVAALTAVLGKLDADNRAKAAQAHVTRDRWADSRLPEDQFNPSAFRNVRYY